MSGFVLPITVIFFGMSIASILTAHYISAIIFLSIPLTIITYVWWTWRNMSEEEKEELRRAKRGMT